MWIAIPGQGVMEVNIKFGLRVPSDVAILGNVSEAYARRVVSVKPIPTSYWIYYHFLSATNFLIWFSNVHITNKQLAVPRRCKGSDAFSLDVKPNVYQGSNAIRDTVMPGPTSSTNRPNVGYSRIIVKAPVLPSPISILGIRREDRDFDLA